MTCLGLTVKSHVDNSQAIEFTMTSSYVMLLWLTLASGGRQVLMHQNYPDEAACKVAGVAQVEKLAGQGKKGVYQCMVSHEEVTDDRLDANGNLITN